MTSQKNDIRTTIDTSSLPSAKLLKQQLQRKFAKKQAPGLINPINTLKPKQPPMINIKKQEVIVQEKHEQSNFTEIMADYQEHHTTSHTSIRRLTSRESRNFDLNPELGDVIVIHPHQQQKNPTFRRISAKYGQQMEYFHERRTLSHQKLVDSRADHLLDQWFLFSEHQNRVVRGVPVLIIKTFAKLLGIPVPQSIDKAERSSSIIISRQQFCDNVQN